MSRPHAPQPRPLVPRLIMGGFLVLLLSWLAFMAVYVYRQAKRPRPGTEVRVPPPPGARGVAPTGR